MTVCLSVCMPLVTGRCIANLHIVVSCRNNINIKHFNNLCIGSQYVCMHTHRHSDVVVLLLTFLSSSFPAAAFPGHELYMRRGKC